MYLNPDTEKKSAEETTKLVKKVVSILEKNLSKEEFLEFQLFMDGNGPLNLFDELITEKAMELAPELFVDDNDDLEEIPEGHYVDHATRTGMYDHDY